MGKRMGKPSLVARSRRWVVVTMSVGLLVACGGGDTVPEATQTQDEEPPASPAPTEDASAATEEPTAAATEEPVAVGDYQLTFDPESTPCHVIDEGQVGEILGTEDFTTFEIKYGEEYPEEFNSPGFTAGQHFCLYSTGSDGGGSNLRVNLGPGEPTDNRAGQYRDSPSCEVTDGTVLGGDAVRLSCTYPEGGDESPWQVEAGHIGLLGDGLFQCVAGLESGDAAELATSMDDFCLAVVEQLASG